MSQYITFSSVSFSYENSQNILFEDLNLSFSKGWTGISGSNGTGKTTLFSLILGSLKPDAGLIRTSGNIVYCPQLYVPISYDDYPYIYDYSKETCEYKRLLGLDDEMFQREDSLSGGEKKRVQLFAALSKRPDILLLDEPTNHLDEKSQSYLLSALKHFDGIGLVISHDRRFMSALTDSTILFFKQGKDRPTLIEKYPLPLDKTLDESERIQESLLQERHLLSNRINLISKSINVIENEICEKNKHASKRGLDKRDHDSKQKVDLARVSGKDRGIADRKGVLKYRMDELEKEMGAYVPRLKSKTGLDSYFFEKPHSDLFIEASVITAGCYELTVPSFSIKAGEHIAILGDNGTGKSLLMEKLYAIAVKRYGENKVLYIKQDYNERDFKKLISSFESLSFDDKARVISDLYRLGSKAESFTDVNTVFSPGEMKKLSLVLGLQRDISIFLLDEPTNHLDVVSTRLLEKLLNRIGSTVLVVSHDPYFIAGCTSRKIYLQRQCNEGDLIL